MLKNIIFAKNKAMTTITIQNGDKLSKNVFKSFEDLIDEYFKLKGKVLLQEIDIDDLPKSIQQSIHKSKEMGAEDLIDFQG